MVRSSNDGREESTPKTWTVQRIDRVVSSAGVCVSDRISHCAAYINCFNKKLSSRQGSKGYLGKGLHSVVLQITLLLWVLIGKVSQEKKVISHTGCCRCWGSRSGCEVQSEHFKTWPSFLTEKPTNRRKRSEQYHPRAYRPRREEVAVVVFIFFWWSHRRLKGL